MVDEKGKKVDPPESLFAMKEKKQEAPVRKTGFFKGVKAEFKKIIWPNKAAVAKETGAVVYSAKRARGLAAK